MTGAFPTSIPRVVDVVLLRGSKSAPDAAPDVLLEVPHGATRTEDFTSLRAEFVGSYPEHLEDFFHVNTDVGAPEVAARAAPLLLALDPRRTVVVAASRIPRTFVDCNRLIDVATAGRPSAPGEMTPGLMPWMTDARDRALALDRHARYRAVVTAIAEAVLDAGGVAIQVHTYAPRSVDVAVNEGVVAALHAAYEPSAYARWPLREEIDLIVTAPDGRRLAAPRLVAELREGYGAAGFGVAENGAYALHPSTVAGALAARFPERTLCYEMRRDLLVETFVPFRAMAADAAKVERHAAILAGALDRNGFRG